MGQNSPSSPRIFQVTWLSSTRFVVKHDYHENRIVLLKKLACFDPQCKKDTLSLQALSQKIHRPPNGVKEHVAWINNTVLVTKYVHND